MDSLGSLNAFVTAAESGSYVSAGRQLGISSSAVGKAITRLEERLSTRLFHRSTRSLALTPEGKLFLERCRRIFSEMEAAELELAEIKNIPQGRIRVSLPLAGMLFMPVLTNFMNAYPEIKLDLDFTDRVVDVIDEGFDIVIRTGKVNDSRLKSKTLGNFDHKIVASPAYLKQYGTPKKPEDLKKHSYLLYKFSSNGKIEKWPFKKTNKNFEMDFDNSFVTNTIDPLIHLTEEGLGISCIPNFAIKTQLEKGSLVTILDKYLDQVGTFKALWPSSKYCSPRLRVFIDYLATHLFAR